LIRAFGYTYVRMSAFDARPLARLFKCLGDETRLRIVTLLSQGELCVCHLEEALRLAQPSVSRHLGTLRVAGVVEYRREGSWVYYRLARQGDPDCDQHLKTLMRSLGKRSVLRRDRARLVRVRGPESCK
jgi:ArsR family transcriptional regulator